LMDHGLIGGGRTAWPTDCGPDEAPRWLVFGAMLRAASLVDLDSGLVGGVRTAAPGAGIAMDELGFEDVTPIDIVESFCRHLMLGTDEWLTRGPKAVVKRWLDRLGREPGLRHGIEPNGDLLIKSQTADNRLSLVDALARSDWFDRERGEPKL
jgi:hypothetical protein